MSYWMINDGDFSFFIFIYLFFNLHKKNPDSYTSVWHNLSAFTPLQFCIGCEADGWHYRNMENYDTVLYKIK